MKFLPLLWSSLWRKKVRTIFTLLSIFVAFLLFGLLMTIRGAFSFGVDIAGIDRLVLIHKVSLIMPLPVSYLARLNTTEGVTMATHNTWFGGVYQDPSNFFAQMVVEPEPFMKIYPEFKIPPDQVKAWLADRQGAIVTDPTLLLADEPTGDLDRKSGDEILDLLQALNRDHGKTIVMVTHDPRAAERAKRTLHLEKGQLMEGAVFA